MLAHSELLTVTVHAKALEWEGTWQILDPGWERKIQVAIRDVSGAHRVLQVVSNKDFELEIKINRKPSKGQGSRITRLTFLSITLSTLWRVNGRRMQEDVGRQVIRT